MTLMMCLVSFDFIRADSKCVIHFYTASHAMHRIDLQLSRERQLLHTFNSALISAFHHCHASHMKIKKISSQFWRHRGSAKKELIRWLDFSLYSPLSVWWLSLLSQTYFSLLSQTCFRDFFYIYLPADEGCAYVASLRCTPKVTAKEITQ